MVNILCKLQTFMNFSINPPLLALGGLVTLKFIINSHYKGGAEMQSSDNKGGAWMQNSPENISPGVNFLLLRGAAASMQSLQRHEPSAWRD